MRLTSRRAGAGQARGRGGPGKVRTSEAPQFPGITVSGDVSYEGGRKVWKVLGEVE